MKILHIGPKNYPPDHGGVEKVVWDIVQGMDRCENHIFTEWLSEGVNVQTLTQGLIRQWQQVKNYTKYHGIQIVHLHKEAFIPLALLLQVSGLKCVLTVHGCAWRISRWSPVVRLLFFLLDCAACCLLKKVVFVGAHDWNLFQRLLPFSNCTLVYNGIDVYTHAREIERSGWVYVGRISPEKNIVAMIEAAEKAQIALDLYGPFDRHDEVFKDTVMASLRQCKVVRWHGPIPFTAVRPTITKYAVFVNLSFSEGLPLSVLEAASEGLYLILSDIPQHRVLGFPECAFTSPHAPDFECVSRMPPGSGTRNRDHAQAEYGVKQMVQKYISIYESL